ELTRLSATPIAIFYCPSRRPAAAHLTPPPLNTYFNANAGGVEARSDYAANLGPIYIDGDVRSAQWLSGPSSFTRADQGIGFFKSMTFNDPNDGGATKNWMVRINGIIFQAFEYKLGDILDGTAQTYMVGEKYLTPDRYASEFRDNGDDQSCWAGDDLD